MKTPQLASVSPACGQPSRAMLAKLSFPCPSNFRRYGQDHGTKGRRQEKLLELSEKCGLLHFRGSYARTVAAHAGRQTDLGLAAGATSGRPAVTRTAHPYRMLRQPNPPGQPVRLWVCFRNGCSSKKDYRHFNVKRSKASRFCHDESSITSLRRLAAEKADFRSW